MNNKPTPASSLVPLTLVESKTENSKIESKVEDKSKERMENNNVNGAAATTPVGGGDGGGCSAKSYSTCRVHGEVMNLYCEVCQVPLCCLCLTSEHKVHAFCSLSERIQKAKGELEKDAILARKRLGRLTRVIKEAEGALSKCPSRADDLKKLISERAEKIVAAVRSHEIKLIDGIDCELKNYETDARGIIFKLRRREDDLKKHIFTFVKRLDEINSQNVAAPFSLLSSSSSLLSDDKDELEILEDFDVALPLDDGIEANVNLERAIGKIHRGLTLVPIKEHKLSGSEVEAFATSDDYIFVGYNSNIWGSNNECRVDVLNYDDATLKSSHVIGGGMSRLLHLLEMEKNLFVLARDVESLWIVRVDVEFTGKPTVVYRQPLDFLFCRRCLSRSVCGNILVISGNKMAMVTPEGHVLETIDLPFMVQDAAQLDRFQFVVCSVGEICIVDKKGAVVSRRPKQFDLARNECLARDKSNNIFYVDYKTERLEVIGEDLKPLASHDIGPGNALAFYHDWSRDAVLLLRQSPKFKAVGSLESKETPSGCSLIGFKVKSLD